jgi:hypothetical protein
MPDPRLQAVAGLVSRIDGAARWLAWTATRVGAVGAVSGAVLWWFVAGSRVSEWWRGTAGSLLVLVLCLLPAVWLLNVRMSLLGLVELPETLGGVATRRTRRPRDEDRPSKPDGGVLGTVRSLGSILQDYGDVAGSWGTVVQVLAPSFWLLTAVAFVAVPVLLVAALVAALLNAG